MTEDQSNFYSIYNIKIKEIKVGVYTGILYGNACQCKIIFKEWIEAGRLADASLKGYKQESNTKNLYRKGLCHLKKGTNTNIVRFYDN